MNVLLQLTLTPPMGRSNAILLDIALVFAISLGVSFVAAGIARYLFPSFRSGERKSGLFRRDQPAAGRELRTIELPLLGGPAMALGIIVATLLIGWFMQFTLADWRMTAILLLGFLGYMAVGFVDDWRKVHRGAGITELQKLLGVLFVSFLAAIALNRLVLSARFAYSPYSEVPLLGAVLRNTHFAWVAFFILLTCIVGAATSLSVDFADGLDGLSGGLILSTAVAFAVIIGAASLIHTNSPLIVLCLGIAGASLGFLPWNWPSSWAARGRGRARRHAKIIMGDSGALGLGGLLALIIIVSRTTFQMVFIGGVFVLEGASALISAKLLTKFFRRYLHVTRFTDAPFVPHTEFPLPFLATPLHQHFDLLGWDRRLLVFGAWALSLVFALLGITADLAPFTWERYLARFVALLIGWLVWQTGAWTHSYFIGIHPIGSPRGRLALYYGYPYRLGRLHLYYRVEVVDVGPEAIFTPAEKVTLWQRMNSFDARALLGYYCYRAGYYTTALTQWEMIPKQNLELRPEITTLFDDVRDRIAIAKEVTQPMLREDILGLAKGMLKNGHNGNGAPSVTRNDRSPAQEQESISAEAHP
jgi:UDP-N-acetylmuramyl pentapeptide phosphotransferase/UDP-N-acetylglucosamine-1-phosphate transferase